MTPQQRAALSAEITQRILHTKQEIERYEELTKPIAPDRAIGRLTRMEAIGAKSIDESILRKLRLTLSELERAAAFIEDEEFGICVDCDEPIPYKRLQIFPGARRCVRCRELHDRGE